MTFTSTALPPLAAWNFSSPVSSADSAQILPSEVLQVLFGLPALQAGLAGELYRAFLLREEVSSEEASPNKHTQSCPRLCFCPDGHGHGQYVGGKSRVALQWQAMANDL